LGRKGRLTQDGLRQMLERRCTDAGIAHIDPHRFRHTFAHEANKRGTHDDALMQVAGWQSPQMLLRYGKSAATERAREAHRQHFGNERL
jgi:integrase